MTFEPSGFTKASYLIALSWILLDGSYKSVFVRPEDHWTEWDAGLTSSSGKTRQDLIDRGESALDIINEMELDVETGIIYVEDVEMAEVWLENLFDAYQRDIPFEIRSIFEVLPSLDADAFDEERRFLIDSNNMNFTSSEDQILVLQRIWSDYGDASESA